MLFSKMHKMFKEIICISWTNNE